MTERLTCDLAPETVFADTASRRITGLAIPLNATAEKAGRVWRFLRDSVAFGDRTPLLAYHDATRPVGRLTESRWSDRGLEVTFAVSKTTAGDEVLQLANDGVLGLSVGIDVPAGGARTVGEELHVSAARAAEVSLTPIPAFAGSVIDHVALSSDTNGGTAAMPDENTTTAPAIVTLDTDALGAAIGAAFAAATATQTTETGPETVPVPNTASATVSEPPCYRFDGVAAAHGFIADAVASSQGSGEATNRLNGFLRETFAVTTGNTTALNPTQNRPDMYVAPLRYQRPLAGLISTGSISDATPFVVPRFNSAGNLVAPHVEGVEPALGNFSATSQTITPGALSGKCELTREVFDQGGSPQVDALVWQEMIAASAEAAEARVAAMLDALTLTPVAIDGTDTAVVDALTAELVALQFARGGNRYRSLALASDLYGDLVAAKDSNGRKLLPVINPTNADGTTSANFGSVQVGNATGTPVWGLGANSYLLVPESVWQWLSPPQKLTFDIQVKSVYIGLFQYSAETVIRTSDVIRLTHA